MIEAEPPILPPLNAADVFAKSTTHEDDIWTKWWTYTTESYSPGSGVREEVWKQIQEQCASDTL